MAYNLKKFFRNFGGLNLADPELLKDDTISTTFQNAKYGDNLSIIKRRGHKRILRNDPLRDGSNGPGGGCITYVERSTGGELPFSRKLLVSDTLYSVLDLQLGIVYLGSDTPAVSVEVVEGVYTFILTENGEQVFSFPLGALANDLDAPFISQLVTAINATGLFTASPSGADTFANLLAATPATSFGTVTSIPYSVYEPVNHSGPALPFSDHWLRRNEVAFELTDHIQTRGCIYLTDIDSGLWKYDGLTLHKVPNFQYPTISASSTSGTENYKYKVLYKFTDFQGNISYSLPSETLETVGKATLNLVPLDPGTSPYLAATATQIILRTVAEGSDYFVLDEVAISEDEYIDTVTDDVLINNEPYSLPEFTVGDTDNYSYIDIFREQLVMTGSSVNPDKVVFENILSKENFFELNSFTTESRQGGTNTGVKSLDNFLYIFKAKAIFLITGELDTNRFQVDTISDEGIGCLSNKSLVEYQRRIWFLGNRGIYSISSSSLQVESRDISPLFKKELRKVATNRAFSLSWVEEDLLLINLPERIAGNRFSNSSRTLVHDKNTNTWGVWDNHNLANGADTFEFKIFFAADTPATSGINEFEVNESLHTNSRVDYIDNESGIDWIYASNWESYGEPSIPKKYVRLKLYSLDTPLQNFEETDFTINIETQHEFLYSAVSQTSLAFSDNLGGWGIDPWGQFPWAHTRKRTRRTRLKPQKTRAIRTVLSNNAVYENVLLSGYEFEVAVEHGPYMRQR